MITILALISLAAGNGTVSGSVTDQGRPVADAVVWLEGGEGSSPGHAMVDQRHQTFEPHIQVVTVGSRIDFPNNDDVFHNVYAEFQAKRFDLGVYPRGKSKSVKFDKPGVVSVRCNVHSQMSAYIIIVDTPFFTKTDAKGRFKISDVPERGFTAHVWHESGKSATSKVNASDARDLKLTLTR